MLFLKKVKLPDSFALPSASVMFAVQIKLSVVDGDAGVRVFAWTTGAVFDVLIVPKVAFGSGVMHILALISEIDIFPIVVSASLALKVMLFIGIPDAYE